MSQPALPKSIQQPSIEDDLKSLGFIKVERIVQTLQGSIWRGYYESHKTLVIKVSNRNLHKLGLATVNNQLVPVMENVLYEASILKYLTEDNKCPQSIVKYHNTFKTYVLFPCIIYFDDIFFNV